MDFLSILYQLIFMPLQIVFEIIYFMAFKVVDNPGIAIIALSFIVNILVLPLYNRADAVQEAERNNELKLSKGVKHIKKTFRGDEQLMMLQTYYRQNNYSPIDSIKGSITLFLEIPFFVAAYQFLSHLELLNGASLGFIKDLGMPDGFFSIAGVTINVLPFVMTTVNIASTYFFTKGLTRKTKIQLYSMACFFLVFLYDSPAGLVCYWTFNNVFNLVKTIICKIENLHKTINDLLNISVFKNVDGYDCSYKQFLCYGIFLSVLLGLVIPTAVIGSSPQEFVISGYFVNPLAYVVNALAISLGTFVVWAGVFYWLANVKYRVLLERVFLVLCFVTIANYMFFGKDLGVLSSTLQYENGIKFSKAERIINAIVVLCIVYTSFCVWKRYRNKVVECVVFGIIALVGLSVVNIKNIYGEICNNVIDNEIDVKSERLFSLSKHGKNVVVMVLDRAMGTYVPYIFKENFELKDKFNGFKYYSNVISHGGSTNFGMPGVYGGYEYVPVEMNKRKDELLVDKHNESLKVLPVLFDRNNFDVTVLDAPYANYKWIPDLSIFDEYTNIKKYITIGKYSEIREDNNQDVNLDIVKNNNRNFYYYSLMKCSPLLLQRRLYDGGRYNNLNAQKISNQIRSSLFTAINKSKNFLKSYNVLTHLRQITGVVESGNKFIVMMNDTTHEPCLLQMPDYQPAYRVDNTKFEKNYNDGYVVDGTRMKMENQNQVIHYHTNMAVFIQLGKWFDYLRENNVYDNTRIILVADHGRTLNQIEKLIHSDGLNVESYFPLLMVKDFYSNEFSVSNEFMTNADVPSIAMKDVIDKPRNPFTGKYITMEDKINNKQYIIASSEWNVNKNNGTTFLPSKWYSVHTDIWKKENWKLVKNNDVLPY